MSASALAVQSAFLGEVVEQIDYGLTASAVSSPVGPKFLRITDVQAGVVNWGTVPYCRCTDEDRLRFRLRPGDIVFARTGATTGKSFLVRDCPDDAVFASYLIRIRPGRHFYPPYLSHYFTTIGYWRQISQEANGSTQPGVNATKLARLEVPLPSMEEQRRVASILDHAEELRRKRQEALRLADQFLRSVFSDLFDTTGETCAVWKTANLGSVGQVQGGLQVTQERRTEVLEVPYLRVANVFRDRLDLGEVKVIRVSEAELERVQLERGDVLVVEGHGNPEEIGRSAVWNGQISPCVHQNHLIRVRSQRDALEPVFLSAFLNSPAGRRQMFAFGKTTSGLNTISTSNVKAITVPLPPLTLQREYCRLVDRVRGQVARMTLAQELLEDLRASLTLRAFRGEL